MLDVHLMIERPERQVSEFVRAGAHSVTFHLEATPHAVYAANLIRDGGACVGVAINPATPVAALEELAGEIDLALCMTISPGWGGQPFIERSPQKIARLRALLDGSKSIAGEGASGPGVTSDPGVASGSDPASGSGVAGTALEVDGGIDPRTAPLCRARGATVFVAGSAIFGADDPGAAYRAIADAIDAT